MMPGYKAPVAYVYLLILHGILATEKSSETSVFMLLKRSSLFDDKIMTSDILSTQTASSSKYCSSYCASQSLCLSFFYNKYSFLCQTHSLVFADPASSLVSVNTSYFHITRGNTFLEPIKDCDDPPTETNVVWKTGTNYLTSRRNYYCQGALLPTASEVQCLASGNWTLMSGFCRNLESCEDVQTCSSTNGDGTYLLYPPVLGGHGVHIYCHNMDTDPKAYVTLFEENISRNDFSEQINFNPCVFRDRNGDSYANFSKINVNLTDMSVNRNDMTFAITYQETHRYIPPYGESSGCSIQYNTPGALATSCPAPGVFIINTKGTSLIVDPDLTWINNGWATRPASMERSADGYFIRGAVDGWCAVYYPSSTMYLRADINGEQKGTAITPVCPDL